MNRDEVVPYQRSELRNAELIGLDEIRIALKEVEELRLKGTNARVEILDGKDDTALRIRITSFKELQEFITHRYSRMLVDGIDTAIPLDDFERLVSETTTHLLDDTQRIRGCVKIE
jgi:hypothetical protein